MVNSYVAFYYLKNVSIIYNYVKLSGLVGIKLQYRTPLPHLPLVIISTYLNLVYFVSWNYVPDDRTFTE